jgi:hypothetical protein
VEGNATLGMEPGESSKRKVSRLKDEEPGLSQAEYYQILTLYLYTSIPHFHIPLFPYFPISLFPIPIYFLGSRALNPVQKLVISSK